MEFLSFLCHSLHNPDLPTQKFCLVCPWNNFCSWSGLKLHKNNISPQRYSERVASGHKLIRMITFRHCARIWNAKCNKTINIQRTAIFRMFACNIINNAVILRRNIASYFGVPTSVNNAASLRRNIASYFTPYHTHTHTHIHTQYFNVILRRNIST